MQLTTSHYHLKANNQHSHSRFFRKAAQVQVQLHVRGDVHVQLRVHIHVRSLALPMNASRPLLIYPIPSALAISFVIFPHCQYTPSFGLQSSFMTAKCVTEVKAREPKTVFSAPKIECGRLGRGMYGANVGSGGTRRPWHLRNQRDGKQIDGPYVS